MAGASPVRAPRGTTITPLSAHSESHLRMLQNNLDPEVDESPDGLVVDVGTGRAARDWASFDAMVRTLTTLGDDETLLVQSGRRSEERRVGKECRSRWGRYRAKKKGRKREE